MASLPAHRRLGERLRLRWWSFAHRVSWTPPTSTEIGLVAKAGLAAALAWWTATLVTDVPDPVLAPLAALVTVQVSVRASVRHAFQRSGAVVLGVIVAIAVGDAIGLNMWTVGLLTGLSLAVAQLLLRLPRPAATQVPVSALVVLAAIASRKQSYGFERAIDTLIGAGVGVAVSLLLPASRLTDARQTIGRLARALSRVLEEMATGLQAVWTAAETAEWRRIARTARERLVDETQEAVGNGREAAKWNLRDRRHIAELGRYEEVLPRLERTAIGVSVISRGLDDHAHLAGGEHQPMPDMAALLAALADAVRLVGLSVLGECDERDVAVALEEVHARRAPCEQSAFRQAQRREGDQDEYGPRPEGEWLSYAALLVQVDRIVGDLSAPLPT